MDIQSILAEHSREALLELARSLVGKGDSEDIPRLYRVDGSDASEHIGVVLLALGISTEESLVHFVAFTRIVVVGVAEVYHIRDTVDDNSRLAASRARKHEQRTVHSKNSLALAVVHTAEVPVQSSSFSLGKSVFVHIYLLR